MGDVVISEETWRKVERALAWQRNFRVTGNVKFANTGDGCSLHVPPYPPGRPGGGPQMIRFKITSAATGGGKYNAKSLTGGAETIDPTTNLAESDFGTLASAEDLLVMNPMETGKATHDLTNGSIGTPYGWGWIIGITSDGVPVVEMAPMPDTENCT